MSLWVFVYQQSAISAWLTEDGDRWILEDMSGYWLTE